MSVDRASSRQKPNVRLVAGSCERCSQPFTGRPDKRFCSDNCRTKGGREQKAREAMSGLDRFDRAMQEVLAAASAFRADVLK
jgi:hypothetical protein